MIPPPLYHGTRRPFTQGGLLLPASKHGGPMRDATQVTLPRGWNDDRADWVYVTPDLDLAWAYAEGAPGRGRPRVLEVTAGGQVEVDVSTVNGDDVEAYRCEWAHVTAVHAMTAGAQ